MRSHTAIVLPALAILVCAGCKKKPEHTPEQVFVLLPAALQACDGSTAKQFLSARSPPAQKMIADLTAAVTAMGRISTAARQQFGERSFLKDMDCQQFKMDDVAPEARAAISGETATILSRDGKAIFLINRDGWKVDVDRNVAVTPVSEAQLRQMETLARVLGPFADQLENSRFPNEEAAEAAFMQAMEAMKGAP